MKNFKDQKCDFMVIPAFYEIDDSDSLVDWCGTYFNFNRLNLIINIFFIEKHHKPFFCISTMLQSEYDFVQLFYQIFLLHSKSKNRACTVQ